MKSRITEGLHIWTIWTINSIMMSGGIISYSAMLRTSARLRARISTRFGLALAVEGLTA
jgi:hypothetical protein